MSFSQALSGLNAQSSKLGTIGNNISNSQTVGFKSSSTQFADVFANSEVGLGTRVSAVLQNFSEGNLESTSRNLDLAVAGQGFFRFQQPSGEVVYSRNGQLTMTSDGDLVNAQGAQIMGYGLNAEGDVQVGGQPVPLNVEAEEMPASATTNVSTTINLDARSQPGEELNSVDVNGGDETLDYHFSNNFTAYDSLGNPRNFNIYYEKTGNNTWTGRAVMDGSYTAANDFTAQFSANGLLTTPTNDTMPEITFDQAMLGGEPADLEFTLDIAGSTQFGNSSTTSELTQNGYTSGSLVGIEIEDDGTVVRNYANEQSRPSGQIALVSFRNPEGLNPSGDNVWAATEASGAELVGEPGTGLRGMLQSSAIETSNVDMARELVDMIVTQRAYQANSQTIKTQDELLQTAINLR